MRRRVLCQEHVQVSFSGDAEYAAESEEEEMSVVGSVLVADEIDTIDSDLCKEG